MHIIAVYDMGERRVAKMLKLCRRYLHWIQNSVFEGELTAVQLKQLIHEAKKIMDLSTDSFIIFTSDQVRWVDKQIIGNERNSTDVFL